MLCWKSAGTVLVDGVPMMSCTLLVASCEDQEITTVEGVAEHGALAAIQKALAIGAARSAATAPQGS